MITTLDHTIKELIQQTLEEAKQTNQSVIVSHIKEVDAIDPLHFLASSEELFLGERFLWSTPERDFTLAGVGNELILENNHSTIERFSAIEKEWKRFKKRIINTNSKDKQDGTGPLLFGGFSFDPIKEKDPLWEAFSEAKFTLPTVMVTIINSKTYLTVNKLVTPHDDLLDCLKHFEQSYSQTTHHHLIDCEKVNEFSTIEYKTSQWLKAVDKATNEIRLKEMDKVVLAREVHLKFAEKVNPYQVLDRLHKEQPTSFIFGFENGLQHFVGATPERLIKKQDNEVLSTCLAGSIKRGKTQEQDIQLGEQLLKDAKNLIEHDIVVKMIKEALTNCCYEVISPNSPTLLKTKNIQHLYTPVRGYVQKGHSLLSIVESLHPTPALGGFPKEKAIEKIRELEPMHRGWYAAPIGWLDADDNGEFVVAIRSGLIEGHNVALFAGCGIVEESNPKSEYLETKIKLKPMMSALGGVDNE
ncbi:menaquinone-specific isochorismate synthase [Metabacillus crassostreae]|uniref:isochorismate synthase n=1 Tax=Metabacillus crassostreae TaxID=929098 RepID=UPI0019572727|nr:isochorismate synthase [Metabacillus crassostreae]MBM7606051.1 menaquinone-specific isochorismate synthase [Metabacillus crassostreae]